ncbi:hypothetical protein [Tranquillimonas alkanivorans]|uniref:Uncharacterized protein n=1 Tax=Tranquillimonas alkanivorans TaxID=441119 RepID=A0A1I5PUH4_9RHOB|nr:hypothetical protein [Tranquillimonas alkanivorans]SFP37251.1 hypothetical protein SAMN04488047_105239 [Tranquillimonas alkanivorans]
MFILDSEITHARRDRDFGRVEAEVALLAKTRSGQPPHAIRLRTNVPARGSESLRVRILRDAARLARRLPQGRTLRLAA